MKRALELSLAISLALGAGNAWAVGLGQIQVKSRLNQPLVAEIPVTVDRGSDAETLSVSLASAEEFARIGIERSQIGVPLEFAVSKSAGGQTVIRVTSAEPVRAPFLDFLVAANWNNGRVLREYTVLLDPPSTAPAVATMPEPVVAPTRVTVAALPPPPPPVQEAVKAPPPLAVVEPAKPASKVVAEPTTPPESPKPVATRSESAPAPTTKPEPRPEPAPVAMAPQKPPAPVAAPAPRSTPVSKPLPPSVAASNGTNYGPVAAGETLWEIAKATLPDEGVSANQLMLALLKANPEAFSRNNINRLKRGAILRIPSAEDIRAVGSMREATAQVRSQIADWRQPNSAPTLLAGTAAANVSKTETPSKTSSKTHDDRLALVPPEMGGDGLASTGQAGSSAGTAAGNVSAAELARANETLASAKQEAGELRSRVKDLEDLKSKNDRLISLKDSAIADLQRKLAAAQAGEKLPASSAPTPSQAIDKTAAATPSVEPAPATTTPAKDDIWGDKPPATPAAVETPPGTSDPADRPESTVTTGEPGATPPAPVASKPEPNDAALTSTTPATTPTASIVNPGDSAIPALTPPAVVDETQATDENPWYLDPRILGGAGIVVLLLGILAMRARRKPVSGRPSIADKFASAGPTGGSVVQASDGIVLLDEESQLAEQIAQHPDDLGARLELLSIYYADNRVEEFRAGALQMQPHVDDPGEAEWVQVRAMGEDLLPHDPLFSSADDSDAVRDTHDEHDDWSAGDNEAADPNLRWSDDGEDDVEAVEPHHHDVVAAPFVAAASDDLSRYAPAAVIDTAVLALPSDAIDVAAGFRDDRFDADVAPRQMEPSVVVVEPDRGLDFTLEDDADLDFHVPSAVATPAADRIESAKPTAFGESEVEPTIVDDSFEFDLPPLDFESEFSKPVSDERPVGFDDEIGEDLDEEFLIGEDALGTKLDLARAYADMGDPDGARGMLEEVIAEGDAEQQDQARKLLEELR